MHHDASRVHPPYLAEAYFVTDARTQRGTSGTPVVMCMRIRRAGRCVDAARGPLGRLDLGTPDLILDGASGLNCAWYADILLRLTK
jgi:hypothetical protein